MKTTWSIVVALVLTASIAFAGLVKNPSDLENIQGFAPGGTLETLTLGIHTVENWDTAGYTAAFFSCASTTGTATMVKFGLNSSVTNYVAASSGTFWVNKYSNGTYRTNRFTFQQFSGATNGVVKCGILPMP